MAESSMDQDQDLQGVAVVGMSLRVPGAETVETFWQNLVDAKEHITFFSEEELLEEGIPQELVSDPDFVRARGVFKDPEGFDAAFFGYTTRDAELMDPQHRVFLEECWGALESAGYVPEAVAGTIGVWGGISTGMTNSRYLLTNLHGNPATSSDEDVLPTMLGNENDYFTTRVSYKLNLKGPSVSVQTACSTSLVAIAMAYQSLLTYGCDMALAGGVAVSFPQKDGYIYQEGGIGSPDGHCRPFDADSQGTVFSNGVGVVTLKRLEDALEDGDTIYAVIEGAAINNDGAEKMSFAAPSVQGQSEVISHAQALAGLEGEDITFVECHGTGTPIGDPIEVSALTRAFRETTDRVGFCALGSIKSNMGHLDSAAGVVGFIKTALAIHHRTIPATIHFKRPNPNIDFASTPFFVPGETLPWDAKGKSLAAGISSFGIGGTNAHIILGEAPKAPEDPVAARDPKILPVSGKTKEALEANLQNLAHHLSGNGAQPLDQVAYTLQEGREAFRWRTALVARDLAEARTILENPKPSVLPRRKALPSGGSLAFLLSGGGSQYVDMARGLYEEEPLFKEAVDEGLSAFLELEGVDLGSIWFPDSADAESAAQAFQRPSLQLPAIFILQVALARLWKSFGVEPRTLLGHSLGENTAAYLAGVLNYEDALGLISLRGRLFEQVRPGGMLSVAASEEALVPYLDESLDLAAVNGPEQCTISGDGAALEALGAKLEADGMEFQRIPISIAAHSKLVEPILPEFRAYLEGIDLHPPKIPIVSNLTGTWLTDAQATDPGYWVDHLRNTVRYSQGITELLKLEDGIFLEIGPGKILGSLAKLHDPKISGRVTSSIRHREDDTHDQDYLRWTAANLWANGLEFPWDALRQQEGGRRVPLPTYAFQRRRFFVEPPKGVHALAPHAQGSAVPEAESSTGSEGDTQDARDQPEAEAPFQGTREELILEKLARIIEEMSGLPRDEIDPKESFLELGFDSLFLTQANLRFRKEFKVKITFRQLFDEAPCLDALAGYIHEKLPADAVVSLTSQPSGTSPAPTPLSDSDSAEALPTQAAGPYRPMQKELSEPIHEELQGYIKSFMADYEARTKTSKELTAANRSHFADPRAVSGFKLAFKEIVYPIFSERSKGSRVWDVDGNEYIDCVGGFGAIFFGHAPDFVMEAVRKQTEISVDYGPGSIMAAETAKMVCEFTGMDRATFCNTGSEAVLATMRMARTVTGRDIIATFSGDYHGIFDEVLVRSQKIGNTRRNQPVAPGIPGTANQHMLVLDYGDPASLKILEERAEELAAVLIEPVQSRTPENQPREFLHEVRRITREAEIPMIFDEVITGFRLAPGGAQEWYGVESDIGAYGKVVGAGMPVGIVAGKAEYMDALDGGPWQYGDDSFPEAGVTYFAGTFVRHPANVAAVNAVLKHLKAEGPELQKKLNRKTAWFAEETNRAYRRLGIPIELVYFGSVFLPRYRGHQDYESLFSAHLRHCGIHMWEGRPGFLTTAHSQEDMQGLADGFLKAGTMMLEAGFFPQDALAPRDFEFSANQRELWMAFRMGDEAASAFNEQVLLDVDGPVDPTFMALAMDKAANRFESLRAVVRDDETGLSVPAYVDPIFDFHDLSQETPEKAAEMMEALCREHVDRSFDFYKGPLVRLRLIRTSAQQHRLCLCSSHLVCDGWSTEIVIQAIARYYSAMIEARHVDLGGVETLEAFVHAEEENLQSEDMAEARDFWLKEYEPPLPPDLDLPADHPRPTFKSYTGQRQLFAVDPDLADELRDFARARGCTFFTFLLAAYDVFLHRLTGAEDIVVGVPAAGQPKLGMPDLVVHSVDFLPLRADASADKTFEAFLKETRDRFNDSMGHQSYSYVSLLREITLARDPSRLPLVAVGFNVDREFSPIFFGEVQADFVTTPRSFVKYDLHFNFIDKGHELELEVDHNEDLLNATTVEGWFADYQTILRSILADPLQTLRGTDEV